MPNASLRRVAVLLALCFALGGVAVADDLFPPTWRFGEGTTFQHWTFTTPASRVQPELVKNPYGEPNATITVGDMGIGWFDVMEGYGTKTGIWDLGMAGAIVLGIPNRPIPLPYKDIWVQVTYFEAISVAPLVVIPGAQLLESQSVVVENVPNEGGTWWLDQTKWRMWPNPNFEEVLVTADPQMGSVIDQIVVDTQCIPEPATFVTLLAGGLGLFISRRRRK